MNTPFISFSIEVTGGGSQGCWCETNYRVKLLNQPITDKLIHALDEQGLFGPGQQLTFDLSRQETVYIDGFNVTHELLVTRLLDSSD